MMKLFCGGPIARESDTEGLTTAFALRIGDYVIQFDLGSGSTKCWLWMKANLGILVKVIIVLTHTHWDHVLADQNFAPLFRKGVNAISLPRFTWRNWLAVRLYFWIRTHPAFWPVSAEMFGGKVKLDFFTPGATISTPAGEMETLLGNHPGGVVVYRIKDFVFATDVELSTSAHQARFASFCSLAKVIVLDIQWRQAEIDGKPCQTSLPQMSRKGWGHSSPEMIEAMLQKMSCLPKLLIVTHHDGDRIPEDFQAFEQEVIALLGRYCKVIFAKGGEEYDLDEYMMAA